jgi:hypothetical protein
MTIVADCGLALGEKSGTVAYRRVVQWRMVEKNWSMKRARRQTSLVRWRRDAPRSIELRGCQMFGATKLNGHQGVNRS